MKGNIYCNHHCYTITISHHNSIKYNVDEKQNLNVFSFLTFKKLQSTTINLNIYGLVLLVEQFCQENVKDNSKSSCNILFDFEKSIESCGCFQIDDNFSRKIGKIKKNNILKTLKLRKYFIFVSTLTHTVSQVTLVQFAYFIRFGKERNEKRNKIIQEEKGEILQQISTKKQMFAQDRNNNG